MCVCVCVCSVEVRNVTDDRQLSRRLRRHTTTGGKQNETTKTNAGGELEIMNYVYVFEADAGAGSSEESGSVSVGRTQPDAYGEEGAAEKS